MDSSSYLQGVSTYGIPPTRDPIPLTVEFEDILVQFLKDAVTDPFEYGKMDQLWWWIALREKFPPFENEYGELEIVEDFDIQHWLQLPHIRQLQNKEQFINDDASSTSNSPWSLPSFSSECSFVSSPVPPEEASGTASVSTSPQGQNQEEGRIKSWIDNGDYVFLVPPSPTATRFWVTPTQFKIDLVTSDSTVQLPSGEVIGPPGNTFDSLR